MTLHSALALPLNQNVGDMIPLSHSVRNTLYSKLQNLQLIIIDEVSMIGSKMLHQIDLRLREIFYENVPFGMKNVLLLGDFNQLPPVADKFIFQCDFKNPYALIAGNPLWDIFHGFKLTDMMRQKDDAVFSKALNNLAEGKLNEEEIKLFHSREIEVEENFSKDSSSLQNKQRSIQ